MYLFGFKMNNTLLDSQLLTVAQIFWFELLSSLPTLAVLATSGRILWRMVWRVAHADCLTITHRTSGRAAKVHRSVTRADGETLCRLTRRA
jgi:hypothetical protein